MEFFLAGQWRKVVRCKSSAQTNGTRLASLALGGAILGDGALISVELFWCYIIW